MSRLTHTLNGESVPRNFDLDFVLDMDNETWHGFKEIMNRLAALEDILYAPDGTERISLDLLRDITKTVDTVGVDRLREIVEAERDGRCVVLPCKVGDAVYSIFCGEVIEKRVGKIIVNGYTTPQIWAELDCDYSSTQTGRWDLVFGKTVFLTRAEAEAEAALAEKDDTYE